MRTRGDRDEVALASVFIPLRLLFPLLLLPVYEMADPERPIGDANPAQNAHVGKSPVTAGKPVAQLLDALTATDLIIRRLNRLGFLSSIVATTTKK